MERREGSTCVMTSQSCCCGASGMSDHKCASYACANACKPLFCPAIAPAQELARPKAALQMLCYRKVKRVVWWTVPILVISPKNGCETFFLSLYLTPTRALRKQSSVADSGYQTRSGHHPSKCLMRFEAASSHRSMLLWTHQRTKSK